MKPYKNKVYL